MKKYIAYCDENLAVIEWMKAFEFSDLYDALDELSGKIAVPAPLLLIDNHTCFDPSLDEWERMVYLFKEFKKHFTNRVAYVVSKDLHFGLGRIAHVLCSEMEIVFIPFRDIKEARDWLSKIPP